MLSTPLKIRTLQRKLYTKAKQEPAYRFYALYDKVCRQDILSHAWARVRANGGAPGIDGLTFEAVERGEGVAAFVQGLQRQLFDKTYRSQGVRRVWIPKSDGSQRPLGIPTLTDRVVQMAVKLVIEPIFEAGFVEHSYGFRPKKSAHDAMDAIAESLHQGYTQVIDADLSKYVDSIPHAKLMAVVAERIADGAVLGLIAQWLRAPVIGETPGGGTRVEGGGKGHRRGTPQGGVISPLLANCYLHLLDRIWQRHGYAEKLQARLVRYADDFVVLCRQDTVAAMNIVRHVLERLDLTLNETKSRMVDARKEPFAFLGFAIGMRTSRVTGNRYPHVEPSAKSLKTIKAKVSELTGRNRTAKPMPDIVKEVNQVLRGWTGYFHYRNSSRVMAKLRYHVEERMRTHLGKRHKVRSRGERFARFASRKFYTEQGLYKVPTNAAWKTAYALV